MQLPDYHGGGIVNLMASLQAGLGSRTGQTEPAYPVCPLLPPERVRTAEQVLLLVIDGLGLNYLRAHPEAACLSDHLRGGLTSVFPPTTASAVTSFLTGDAPQQHGLTGWHMWFAELGSVLAVLPGRARYGGVDLQSAGIDAGRLFRHTPFADRLAVETHSLAPRHIADSDFNLTHLGRARLHRFDSLTDLLGQAANLLDDGNPKFVYAYWPELDSLGHRHGIWSRAAREHLLELDHGFELLLSRRGSNTLVVVCADHGQIDVGDAQRIELDRHPRLAETLALPLCGEARAVYCYLRPGYERQFDDCLRDELGDMATAHHSRDLIDHGWFGLGTPHPELHRRVGDRVLLMKEHYLLKDWLAQEPRHRLIGVHGGLDPDELWVPLIVAET